MERDEGKTKEVRKTIVLALLLAFPLVTRGGIPPSSPEMIEKGKKSFATNCAVCHGPGAQGDGVAAAALNPKPRNLVKDEFKAGSSTEAIFKTLSNGLKGTNMQGFNSLSEEERWSLVNYILSIRRYPSKS